MRAATQELVTSIIGPAGAEPSTRPDHGDRRVGRPRRTREQLTRELVDALNAADLDRWEGITAADPYADASMLTFWAESGPYWFEECFKVSGGVPMCDATSDMIGMTIGFTDDDTAIDSVGWAFASGV